MFPAMRETWALALTIAAWPQASGAVPFEPPPAISMPLAEARAALDAVNLCLGPLSSTGLIVRYETLDDLQRNALFEAEKIWGKKIVPEPDFTGTQSLPTRCGRQRLLLLLTEAERLLRAEATAFRAITGQMARGFWFGAVRLCPRDVTAVRIERDEVVQRWRLRIDLTAGTASEIAELTGRSVGGPIALRLDGLVIAEPLVFERLETAWFSVLGPDDDSLERARTELLGGCRSDGSVRDMPIDQPGHRGP